MFSCPSLVETPRHCGYWFDCSITVYLYSNQLESRLILSKLHSFLSKWNESGWEIYCLKCTKASTISTQAIERCFHLLYDSTVFRCCRRQVGKGRVGLGIDRYLLDNRNRTQKWDEYSRRNFSPDIGVSSCLASPDSGQSISWGYIDFSLLSHLLLLAKKEEIKLI